MYCRGDTLGAVFFVAKKSLAMSLFGEQLRLIYEIIHKKPKNYRLWNNWLIF